MHTDMHRTGAGRGLFARMKEVLGRHFGNGPGEGSAFLRKPAASAPLEPLHTDALVRPSMHHRVTIQTHHEDWP
jgi:hypothetical protein